MNPEKAKDCECCFLESDECIYFKFTGEWLCPDCERHASRMLKKMQK